MTEPSKVIHVRNVGHEISEHDLLELVQPFGVVTKIVVLRAKNQALIQMQDVQSAVNAMQFYANVQSSIRGGNVYMQFSSHQELTTDQNSQGRNSDQDRTGGVGVDTPVNVVDEIDEEDSAREGLWEVELGRRVSLEEIDVTGGASQTTLASMSQRDGKKAKKRSRSNRDLLVSLVGNMDHFVKVFEAFNENIGQIARFFQSETEANERKLKLFDEMYLLMS